MTNSDRGIKSMMAEAERKGKEESDIEARNKKRRAKGRKPLLAPAEKKDQEVLNRRYRTDDSTTVDAADAMKLYELRKGAMADPEADNPAVDGPDDGDGVRTDPATEESLLHRNPEDAQRAAEAARRVQDMKNKRIDHDGNWTDGGQSLEKGDATNLRPERPLSAFD